MMLVSIAFSVLLPQAAGEPEKLTLQDATKIGLSRSYDVQVAETNYLKQRDLVRAAEAGLGFKITLQGTYIRYNQSPQSFGPGFKTPIDSKVATGTLSWP